MRRDDTGRARQVACPLCGREPGQPCTSTTTRQPFTFIVHRERVAAARKDSTDG